MWICLSKVTKWSKFEIFCWLPRLHKGHVKSESNRYQFGVFFSFLGLYRHKISLTIAGVNFASFPFLQSNVIRYKSTEFMTFSMCVATFVVSLLWTIYGQLVQDNFILVSGAFHWSHLTSGMLREVQICPGLNAMRFKILITNITKCHLQWKVTKTHTILSNMK